ncbi:MAG: N-acetylmuramoyl-L-alanine amidase [Gemmatimonadota bacterium]|nr:N-acetylmuramoyl-L-alanine amidase [Gemmatimonadota bacterium]
MLRKSVPALALLLASAAIAARGPARASAVAAVADSLAIRVQYPSAGATLGASDSTFVFGEVRGGEAGAVSLTVNGFPATVHPGGGWLAWVPLEPGSFTFRIRAEAGGRVAEIEHPVEVPRPLFAPGPDTLPYKPGTIEPTGALELYAGDTLRVSVVAAPGLAVRARLGGRIVPLAPEPVLDPDLGRRVWGEDLPVEGATRSGTPSAGNAAAQRWRRYAGEVYLLLGTALRDSLVLELRRPGEEPVLAPAAEVLLLDPTRVRIAALDDDTAGTGRTDGRVIGRTGPGLGYRMLMPNGTRAAIARLRDGYREIALAPGRSAWIDVEEVFPIEGPRPGDEIAVVRTRAREGWSEVVLPIDERLPARVEQRLDPLRFAIEVYGLVSNVDWIETAAAEPLIEALRWSQPVDEVFRLEVDLAGDQGWGWRSYWEGTHLVVGFRHPPASLADRRFRSPLHGVRVVVDPGHNPGTGAVGPTGLEEREANLAIALELARILRERGAEVVMTRASPDSALGLYDRTRLAVDAEGEIFVSIHNNALPDGVNPFENNGTSVLFYHPQSEPLAEAVQTELLPRTGLADHGVWHQNLAVLRMSEMPAVLVESAFMMIPEQEALLRTPEYRRAIAEGVAAGLERFLRQRGEELS